MILCARLFCTYMVILIHVQYVADAEPPIIYCPDDIHAIASANDGVVVRWTYLNGTDNSGDIVETDCDIPSGSKFSVGVTNVLCVGYDSSGNNETCTFQVNISQGTGTQYFIIYSLCNPKLTFTSTKTWTKACERDM